MALWTRLADHHWRKDVETPNGPVVAEIRPDENSEGYYAQAGIIYAIPGVVTESQPELPSIETAAPLSLSEALEECEKMIEELATAKVQTYCYLYPRNRPDPHYNN